MPARKWRSPTKEDLELSQAVTTGSAFAGLVGGLHAYWYYHDRTHGFEHPAVPMIGWIAVILLGLCPILGWISWAVVHQKLPPRVESAPIDFGSADDAQEMTPATRRPGVVVEY